MAQTHAPESPFAPPPHGRRLAPTVVGVVALFLLGALFIALGS